MALTYAIDYILECRDMAAHGIQMDLEQMNGLIPSTFQVILILGIMAIVSFFLIDRLYKQRGNKYGSHRKNRILQTKKVSYSLGWSCTYASLCFADTVYIYGK